MAGGRVVLALFLLCGVAFGGSIDGFGNGVVLEGGGSAGRAIPFSEIGKEADKLSEGEVPRLMGDGAILNAPFQALQGVVMPSGLEVRSTAGGRESGVFSLFLRYVGRGEGNGRVMPGRVLVRGRQMVLDRGIFEERISSCADGIRQDFYLSWRPGGSCPLTLLLTLRGGHASSIGGGVGIELEGGRELLYQRLHITDARGSVVAGELGALNDSTIMITAYDADAVYPLTIDPTITDADWFVMNSLPGAKGGEISAVAVAGNGSIYVGVNFVTNRIAAHYIAKWDGSTWSPLGS